jgi:hypothetical protein
MPEGRHVQANAGVGNFKALRCSQGPPTQFPSIASNNSPKIGETYFITNRPAFLSRPDFVSGTPILRDILPFVADTPMARRHENEAP